MNNYYSEGFKELEYEIVGDQTNGRGTRKLTLQNPRFLSFNKNQLCETIKLKLGDIYTFRLDVGSNVFFHNYKITHIYSDTVRFEVV